MFETFLGAAFHALTLKNIAAVFVGVIVGDTFSVIPGMEAVQAMAILLPLTLYWDPIFGLAFMVGMYKGGCFGGSFDSILLGTPSNAESAATVLDGRPLALKGQGGKALRMALFSSITGDVFATVVLMLGTSLIAPIALSLGPPEYFGVVLLSFTTISMASSGSSYKALAAACLGLTVSTIGIDPINSVQRYVFGIFALGSGINTIPFVIGLLSVSAIFLELDHQWGGEAFRHETLPEVPGGHRLTFREFLSCAPVLIRGSLIGSIGGILPGHGAAVSAFTSYAINRKLSPNGKYYGTGVLEGVAASQSADSATAGPSLVPLLTLGIPGSGTAAMFAAALIIHGISPGPLLFQQHADIVYGIYVLFAVGVIANLVGGYALRMYAHKIVQLPRQYLFPAVLLMCIFSVYGQNRNALDVYSMLAFGVVGYVLRKALFPLAPMVMAFILGQLFEVPLRQSLLLFNNDLRGFLVHPIAMAFFVAALLVVLLTSSIDWRGLARRWSPSRQGRAVHDE
jgi:putative tricarboxylic transport membrane protein